MDERLEAILSQTIPSFHAGNLNCAETVLVAMCRYYGIDSPIVPKVATAFGGGFSVMQKSCGALTGGLSDRAAPRPRRRRRQIARVSGGQAIRGWFQEAALLVDAFPSKG
jgi:hypothetical protein